MSVHRRWRFAALVCLLPVSAQGQWPPDSLVNLQVLPQNTSVRGIVGIMRDFASGLGVRCIFCHVGDDPADLSSTDFVSDERIQKRKAREMIRMVREINDRLLAAVPERSEPPVEVTCGTCHHGVTRPVDIREILAQTATEHGADSAIAQYESLREEYYGSAAYDFRPFMLANVAELIGRRATDTAFELLSYNEERHPTDQQTYFYTFQLHLALADTTAAVQALERGLEHLPENDFFRQTIARLTGR